MDLQRPISSTRLSDADKASLKRGKINTLEDLFLAPARDTAQKCRLTTYDYAKIVQFVAVDGLLPPLSLVEDASESDNPGTVCTTGDSILDEALGGGIRTGMIWEVVGESAAGKTQLALQISLCARMPIEAGGFNGSVCYLTTSSTLPTSRLLEISQNHPTISSLTTSSYPRINGLDHIDTLSTPSVPVLLNVLTSILPQFAKAKSASKKPVKLLVLDALAELFHLSGRTSTMTLVDRSKQLTEISAVLHDLALRHDIAVLVLNEVIDYIDRHQERGAPGELVYNEQARIFGSSHSVPGENMKQAALGLVWANQVNVRILLSRTGRRRRMVMMTTTTTAASLDDGERECQKRHRSSSSIRSSSDTAHPRPVTLASPPFDEQALTVIRRLSVVFSSVSRPISLDYIVITQGFKLLPPDEISISSGPPPMAFPLGGYISMPQVENTSTAGNIMKGGDTAALETYSNTPQTFMDEVESSECGEEPLRVNLDAQALPSEDEWDKLLDGSDDYDVYDWDELECGLAQKSPEV